MKHLLFLFCAFSLAQSPYDGYWQQEVDYVMDIHMDVETFRYNGTQQLTYTNHSPDTLSKVFYHLYFNAFQPGSDMDVRSRTIKDPDPRVGDRISKLLPDEIGFLQVKALAQDGLAVDYEEEETILVVELATPLLPGTSTVLDMAFDAQVPIQIRRSGRDNKEGVDLSMTQWYPKLVEYDKDGWHPNPYVGREFHGVWGDFDVSITIDRDYVIGGSGYLQNPEEIGHGYAEKTKKSDSKTLTWHFIAPRVHDFAWAADPDFIHDMILGPNDVELHFFYLNNPDILENWKQLQGDTAKMLAFFNENIGEYPYEQYSVIQGGDGGMEYPMCTLITGERDYKSLFGVTAHELAHSWFHHLLGTNEAKYAWMDEGFTSFYDMLCESAVLGTEESYFDFYNRYYQLVNSGVEEPLTTHADRFQYNFAYGIASYSKGAVFLAQLGYIIGADNLRKTIKRYYEVFKFSHPTANDFKRIAEKVSGMQLEWYLNDWIRTTNTIDYSIQLVEEKVQKTKVNLERIGNLPMPVEVYVEAVDGSVFYYYIPLQMMRGEKLFLDPKVTTLRDWSWANPTYQFEIGIPMNDIRIIRLNPTGLKADVNPNNDIYSKE
jgi:hypothetical protein